MRRFPGRTLDELDGMDWNRYLRALEAENVESVENRRQLFVAGKLDKSDLTPDDWEQIRLHDEWMNDG